MITAGSLIMLPFLVFYSPFSKVRDWIVPVNRRYPLDELMAILKKHFPARDDGSHDRRHVLIEYIMLRDVNDTLDDARRLLRLLDGIGVVPPAHCLLRTEKQH